MSDLLQKRGRKRGTALLLAAALVVGGAVAASQTTATRELEPPSPQAVAPATSGTVYCPVTAAAGEGATLVIAAASDVDTEVVLTRYADGIGTSEDLRLLPGGSAATLPIAAGQLAQPITIDWRGGPILAQYQLTDGDEMAVANCATQPAAAWHLAGFDTSLGSISLLHLFNPFGQDALVSLAFGTPEGPVELVIADELLIPAGQSTVLNLAQFRPETPDLAITVTSRSGRVIPQGQLSLAPAGENVEGITGRALIAGAPMASQTVVIPQATVDAVTSAWLTVYNPGQRGAAVQVQVSTPLGDASTLSTETNVPAGGTTRIDLAGLSALPEFGVEVNSVNGVGVVVTRTEAIQDTQRTGIAVSTGVPAEALGWLVAGGTAPNGTLTLYNPGASVASASVVVAADQPQTWSAVTIPPNGTAELELAQATPEGRATVSSDLPIVAGIVNLSPESATAYWSGTGVAIDELIGGGLGVPTRRDPGLASIPAVSATATPTPTAVEETGGGEGELDAGDATPSATPSTPVIEPPIVGDDIDTGDTPVAPAPDDAGPTPSQTAAPTQQPSVQPSGSEGETGSLFGKRRLGKQRIDSNPNKGQ